MNSLLEMPLIVCGFQKSGNTWIGYLLSYYFNAHYFDSYYEEGKLSGLNYPQRYEDNFKCDKAAFMGGHIRPDQPNPFSCVIKSHLHPSRFLTVHHKFFGQVKPSSLPPILIVRNPKDMAVSYFFYHYFHMRMYYSSVFDRFPAGFRLMIRKAFYFRRFVLKASEQWKAYYEEWKETPHILVRYEDLNRDTYGTMHGLIEKIHGPVHKKYLIEAIEYCHFENLKAMEIKYVRPRSAYDRFFREGKIGGWKKYFSTRLARQFDSPLGSLYKEFGYESSGSPGADAVNRQTRSSLEFSC